MRKFLKTVTAIMLVVIMGTLCPMQAFAASASAAYISDLKLSYGKTAEEAKSWLEGQGYKVVDADLNEGADSVFVSSRAVYLGYKTTRKADEAITDLKVMNMKGNYSFEAYEMVLQDLSQEIGLFVSQLVASLKEYRENYSKGLYKALAAHDMLNNLYDDDTEKAMGDLLLNETVQELGNEAYEKLSDEEKSSHADMVKILMQGNSSVTLGIEQYLCIASDTADNTFVDRLAEIKSYDDFETDYAVRNGIKDGNEIEDAMAAEYDDTALALVSGLKAFRDYLAVYTESEMFGESNEDTVMKWYDENAKDGDYILWCNARNVYLALISAEFEDGTLYDLFTDEEYDLEGEDRFLLYPLVASLSEGQRACAEYVSIAQLFDNGIIDNDGWKKTFDKLKSQVIDTAGTVSVYTGINRELFGDGVALTNAAKKLNESSTESYMDFCISDSISDITLVYMTGFAVTAIAGLGSKYAVSALQKQMIKVFDKNLVNYENIASSIIREPEPIASEIADDVLENSTDNLSTSMEQSLEESFVEYEGLGPSYTATNAMRTSRVILNRIGNVCCILMIIFAVLTIRSAWRDIQNYYKTEKTPIPAYIVDEATDKDGVNTYTYYKAVTCNRVEKKLVDSNNEILEVYGDLNGDIGKEWLALYYTKDASAGKPIKADFLCQKGNGSNDKLTALTLFGNKSALNLVDEKYAFNDDFNGIYLFYSTSSQIFTASAVSSGIIAVLAVAAAVIGFVPAFLLSKKKKAAKEA